ncbi:MAG: dihydrolipoyl dehydrogenase [Candidatus Omnitrophota bacterium]
MVTDLKVNVAVIGAGTAGLGALREIRKQTDDFVLINEGHYGTTCARVGCMPSKVFIQAANEYHTRFLLEQYGAEDVQNIKIDTALVMKRVRDLRDRFVRSVLKTTDDLGEKNIQGHARFIEPNVLDIDGRIIRADAVVVAAGSSPFVPSGWQKFGSRVLTTDDFFEADDLSGQWGVVGGGIIGLELGLALSRLGISTRIVEARDMIGGLTDPEVNRRAVRIIQEDHELLLGAKTDIDLSSADRLSLSCGNKKCQVDRVLVAMGRRPQIKGLGLDALGVELDDHGMPPFDPSTMQVADLPVYLAGDVTGTRPLLHEAADEGRIAGYNAVRDKAHCFRRRVPLAVTFSEPNIAVAGKSFRELQDQDKIIGSADFGQQGRARIMSKNAGLLRIYAEPECGRLLGAEMAAPDGEYIAHLLAWAVQNGWTACHMRNLPFYHPTILEGLRSALRDVHRQTKNPQPEMELPPCEPLAGECFN